MATEQITYAEEQAELPNALEDTEIARLMKLVGVSGYKKSEDAPTRQKEAFKPRTLVEIAMEAQQKRDEEEKLAKEESINTKNVIDNIDTETQDTEKEKEKVTASDSLNIDGVNTGSTDTPAEKETVGTAKPEQLNSFDKEQDPDEASIGQEAVHELTVSENSEIEETSTTQNKQDNLSESTATETELSKAIENAAIRYDEGYRTGVEAGKNEMKEALEQKFSEQQKTFDALITSLTRMNFAETKELETDIQATILSLASERAGIAIMDMPESFLVRIEQLMSRVGNSVDSPVIKLNKGDLEHIEKAREQSETLKKVLFIEEETLNHGDISINLAGIEIEDILENRIIISPLDSDAQIKIEQPHSEATAETSESPEIIDTMTERDNTPNELVESATSALEVTKALKPETESNKQDIDDKSNDIDNEDELS